MEFGLVLSQFTDRWSHLEADAIAAEEAGLDSVWLADHLLATMATEAPRSYASLAVSKPMPRAPPVINTTLPARS